MISLTASIHFDCLILTPSFFNLSSIFDVLRQSSLTQIGFGGNGAAGPRICCGGSTVYFWMCHAGHIWPCFTRSRWSKSWKFQSGSRQKKSAKAERRPKHFWQLKVPTEMGWRSDRRQQHAAHTSQFGYCTALEATDMCVQHTNGILWQSERSQDISESETWKPWKQIQNLLILQNGRIVRAQWVWSSLGTWIRWPPIPCTELCSVMIQAWWGQQSSALFRL